MQFSTSCPACGAALTLTSDSNHVTCPYCNRDFDVDLSAASPDLRPSAGLAKEYSPRDIIPEPEPAPLASEPVTPPPVVEESSTPATTEERPSYAQFEPPASSAPKSQSIIEQMGKWIWVLIIGLVLLCVTCVSIPLIFMATRIAH